MMEANLIVTCCASLSLSPCIWSRPYTLRSCIPAQAAVKHLDDAHDQLDLVIATALRERKPVYINIACNLAGETHPTFTEEPIPFAIYPKVRNLPDSVLKICQLHDQMIWAMVYVCESEGLALRPSQAGICADSETAQPKLLWPRSNQPIMLTCDCRCSSFMMHATV